MDKRLLMHMHMSWVESTWVEFEFELSWGNVFKENCMFLAKLLFSFHFFLFILFRLFEMKRFSSFWCVVLNSLMHKMITCLWFVMSTMNFRKFSNYIKSTKKKTKTKWKHISLILSWKFHYSVLMGWEFIFISSFFLQITSQKLIESYFSWCSSNIWKKITENHKQKLNFQINIFHQRYENLSFFFFAHPLPSDRRYCWNHWLNDYYVIFILWSK